MAVEVVSADTVSVVVSEGPAAVAVRGYGESQGTAIAVWRGARTLAAGSALTLDGDSVTGPFAADTQTLRLPTDVDAYPVGSRGIIFRCVDEENDEYCESSARWGEYAAWTMQLPSASNQLAVRYGLNEGGVNGSGDAITIAVKPGKPALDRSVTVTAYLMQDAVGVTARDLRPLQAQLVTDEGRITALEERPPGRAANLPPPATAEDADAGTGTTPLLWSAARVWAAAKAAISQTWLGMRTGGWVRSASQSHGQLHLVVVRADGTTESLTFTPQAGGGGGITATAARNEAGSLLSTLPEFEFVAGTGTLTFTEPRPTDIAIGELADSVRDLINSKLDGAAVDRRVAANADVRGLRNFEASLRHQDEMATGTVRVAISSAEYRLGAAQWWDFQSDDDIRVEVEYGDDDLSADFTFPASQLRAITTQSTILDSTRANAWSPVHDSGLVFYVCNEAGHIGVAANSPGTYVFSVYRTRTRVTTPFLGDQQVTRAKLAEEIVTQLDEAHAQTGHTDAQIAGIADREAAKYLLNVDLVGSKEVQFSRQFAGMLPGEVGIANANLAFVAGGTHYTIGQMTRRGNGEIAATVTPINSRDALRGFELAVGADRHDFSAAEFDPGDAANPDLYEFPAPSAEFDADEPTRVGVLAPPSTPLPKGKPGQAGYVARLGNDLTPGWAKPTGGFKLLGGPGAGVAVTNNVSDVRGNFHIFRPRGPGSFFNLATEDLDRFLFVSIIFAQSNRSSTSLGFEVGLNPPASVRKTGFVHLEEVRDAAAFDTGSTTAKNGVEIVRAVVSMGTDYLGRHEAWVAKDETNNLGYYVPYVGGDSVAAGVMDWNTGTTIYAYV